MDSLNNIISIVKDDIKTRIVFVPVSKSYLDPMIMFYIHFLYDLELGFTFGNYEDSPKISLVSTLLRRIGTLMVRKKDSKINHDYIYQSLLEEVVAANPFTTVF